MTASAPAVAECCDFIAIVIPGEAVPFARAGAHGKVRFTPKQWIEIYDRHGTLDGVAAEVGLNRATVHEHLQKAGYTQKGLAPSFSDVELVAIRTYYSDTPAWDFSLDNLSAQIGRPKTSVARAARGLGLTRDSREKSAAHRAKNLEASVGVWTRNPHPRGMAGKTHTDEVKARKGAASRLAWATWKAFGIGEMSEESRQRKSDFMSARRAEMPAANSYSRCKAGKRVDLGPIHFRSSWEANYARYLNLLMKMKVVEKWEYEPETFWFEAIKRGVRSYKPDFKVWFRNDSRPEFHEIKGWYDDRSKTKIKRMRIYHPSVKVVLIGAKQYRALKSKWSSAIPAWE